jgi:disintegrin and metalloproteinase domain-containing protein 10
MILGYLGGCGHTDEISQWMERVQNSAIEEEDLPPFVPKKDDPKPAQMPQQVRAFVTPKELIEQMRIYDPQGQMHKEDPRRRYTREANEGPSWRSKRAARPREESRNTCSLFIQTDPLIWKHIAEQVKSQTAPLDCVSDLFVSITARSYERGR